MARIVYPLQQSLFVIIAIIIVAGITFSTLMISRNTSQNYLQSQVYTTRNPVRDLALASASPNVITRLDSIITNVRNKANAYSSVTETNAFIDRYLLRVSTLEDAITSDPAYVDTYSYLFTYLYPRVYELKKIALTCNTRPSNLTDTNTTFTPGTPTTTAQQAWQNTSSSSPCYYTCKSGYRCTANPTQDEIFVRGQYLEILKRDADTDGSTAGLDYWIGQIINGTFSQTTLPKAMACAPTGGADKTNATAWLTSKNISCTTSFSTPNTIWTDVNLSPKSQFTQGESLHGYIDGGDPTNTWGCIDGPNVGNDCVDASKYRRLTAPVNGVADGWQINTSNGRIEFRGGLALAGYPGGVYTGYARTGQNGTSTSASFTLLVQATSSTPNTIWTNVNLSPKSQFTQGESLYGYIDGGDPANTWACLDGPSAGNDCVDASKYRRLTVPVNGVADGWQINTSNGRIEFRGGLALTGYPGGVYTGYARTGQNGASTSASFTLTSY